MSDATVVGLDTPSNRTSERSYAVLPCIRPSVAPRWMSTGSMSESRQFMLSGGSQYREAPPVEPLAPANHPAEVDAMPPMHSVAPDPAFTVPWSVPGYRSTPLHGYGIYPHAMAAPVWGLAPNASENALPAGRCASVWPAAATASVALHPPTWLPPFFAGGVSRWRFV